VSDAPEYDWCDLGDRFAVIRRQATGWKALYTVPDMAEAERFVEVCRGSDKKSMEARHLLEFGMRS
jgi:hypothetical protein